MDDFHERLARVALVSAGKHGFALAGGYAVQAHGILERPSEDVDLFTTMDAEDQFETAIAGVVAAYQAPSFARLLVTDSKTGTSAKVELGIDWRAHPPTILSIGPVLHQDDAVANKITALYSRAQTRDYIDVNAILNSGRYTGEELLTLALQHDPGFDPQLFAHSLMAVERLPLAEFTALRPQRRGREGLDCQADVVNHHHHRLLNCPSVNPPAHGGGCGRGEICARLASRRPAPVKTSRISSP